MTVKEAILRSLDEMQTTANHLAVLNYIKEKGYYDFSNQETPASTVSAALGDFVRNGDSRVKRLPQPGSTYIYYHTRHEQTIDPDLLSGVKNIGAPRDSPAPVKTYDERSLHKLLCSFLNEQGIHSKTIFHEQSNRRDPNQIWTHPDMVGVRLFKLQSGPGQKLFKSINKADTFELSSYEIKKEINTEGELKQAFFQAVSNSSWANHGYLVALDFNDRLMDEIERLNRSFGIGIIKLNGYPYRGKFLFQAKHRELDYKTIDKLCGMSPSFDRLVDQVVRLMNAQEGYENATENELKGLCDKWFSDDIEFLTYCKEKHIPYQSDSEK